MCILVYSQTCFLSEEMCFSEMKSRCSCLHSLLQRLLPRGSVAETMPVGSAAQRFPVAVSQHCFLTSTCYWASQADCLGNPAMLSHYDFITTCFLQVYIMQVTGDLNNSAQYMRYLAQLTVAFLTMALAVLVFLWLIWRPGVPQIAMERVSQASAFHYI